MTTPNYVNPQYILYTSGYAERGVQTGGWGVVIYDEWTRKRHPMRNFEPVQDATQDKMELTALIQGLAKVFAMSQQYESDITIFTRSANVYHWLRHPKPVVVHPELVDQIRGFLQRQASHNIIKVAPDNPNPDVIYAANLARKCHKDAEYSKKK